jgi:hypothetical protein
MVESIINIRIPHDLFERVRQLYGGKSVEACIGYIDAGITGDEIEEATSAFDELPGLVDSAARILVSEFYKSGKRIAPVNWKSHYSSIQSAQSTLNTYYARRYGLPVRAFVSDGSLYMRYITDLPTVEESDVPDGDEPIADSVQEFWQKIFDLFPWTKLHPSAVKPKTAPPIDETSVQALNILLDPGRFNVERLATLFLEDISARGNTTRAFHYHKVIRWWLVEKAAMFDPKLRKVTV